MSDKKGGFFGFIKRLFGLESAPEPPASFTPAPDDDADAELDESLRSYDEAKVRREAEEMIAKSLEDEKTNPHDPEVFYRRAVGYSILDDNAQALELLDQALSIDPEFIDAYRLKATVCEDSENYEEALRCLDWAISLHDDDDAETGDEAIFTDAAGILESYDRSAKIDDYKRRGWIHFKLDNFGAALDDLSKAIEVDPDDDFLYSSRSDVYLEMGETDKALRDINRALEISRDEYNYASRANIHKRLGDFDAALRDITEAVEMNKVNDSEAAIFLRRHFERGEIYMEKGDYESALRDFTAEIERDPEFIGAYEKRAAVYRLLGMESLAVADEQKAEAIFAEFQASETENSGPKPPA